MPMTNAHAKIAAGMLSDDAVKALKVMRKLIPAAEISVEGIQELVDLGFGKNTTNLMDGKQVFVLTEDGKKVANQIS